MKINFDKFVNRQLLSLILLLTILAVSSVQSAEAQSRPTNTELGVILGEPTGISFKLWQSGSTAFGGAVAWSLGRNETVHIQFDYLFHSDLDVDQGELLFYYGPGVRTLFSDNNPRVGVRFPVGLQYNVEATRLSLFFEVAPTLDLIPATTFGVNGGLGFRFYL